MLVARKSAAAIGLAITLATSTAVSQSAFAARGDHGIVKQGAAVRYNPSTHAGIAYITQGPSWINLDCWTDVIDDGVSRRWFRFYNYWLWTLASDVTDQPVLPHCY